MTEIKLTKRYPHSRTEDITDAYMRGWNDALDAVQNGKFHIAEQTEPQTVVIIGTPSHEFKLKNGQTGNEPMLTIATDDWYDKTEREGE